MAYAGRVSFSGSGLDSPGMALAEQLNVESNGTFRLDPLSYQGMISLDGTRVDVPDTVRAERVSSGCRWHLLKDNRGKDLLDATGVEIPGRRRHPPDPPC